MLLAMIIVVITALIWPLIAIGLRLWRGLWCRLRRCLRRFAHTAFDDLVQLAAVEPHAAAFAAVIDLDPLTIAHHEVLVADGTFHRGILPGQNGPGQMVLNPLYRKGDMRRNARFYEADRTLTVLLTKHATHQRDGDGTAFRKCGAIEPLGDLGGSCKAALDMLQQIVDDIRCDIDLAIGKVFH